jgi:spermidine/putrescine transport system substrate-binding protein
MLLPRLRCTGLFTLALTVVLATACTPQPTVPPTPAPSSTVRVFGWENDMPEDVFADFTAETGITVEYTFYNAQDEALDAIRAGQAYDVMVMGNEYMAVTIGEGLARPITRARVPNFANISLNFRDLLHDPGNRFSMPYQWGTTGLVYRRDLVSEPIPSWDILWDDAYAGRIAVWDIPRTNVGITLKSLGFRGDSENPAELEQARARLLELAPRISHVIDDAVTLGRLMASGEVAIALGFAADALRVEDPAGNIAYTIPAGQTLVWGDNFVVPSTSTNPVGGEMLIDFLLRSDISARLTNFNRYSSPNDAAREQVDPALRDNPALFPPQELMRNAQIQYALSDEARTRYQAIWDEARALIPAGR